MNTTTGKYGDNSLYVGIDLAIAKSKRLPVCFASDTTGSFDVINWKELHRDGRISDLPKGPGNARMFCDTCLEEWAKNICDHLRAVSLVTRQEIAVIAIDAPAAFPAAQGTRKCEQVLLEKDVPFFRTPCQGKWNEIKERFDEHRIDNRSLSEMPYANMLWMRAGEVLFRQARGIFGCAKVIETYPHAILTRLLDGMMKKSSPEGHNSIKAALWKHVRAGPAPAERVTAWLKNQGYGAYHDRLDAMLCAWVAYLYGRGKAAPLGGGDLRDTIWVPKQDSLITY